MEKLENKIKDLEDNKDFAKSLIEKVFDKVMGQCLDIMRIGIQTEYSLKQAERNTRQNFNMAKSYLISTLKEKGYIKGGNNGTS